MKKTIILITVCIAAITLKAQQTENIKYAELVGVENSALGVSNEKFHLTLNLYSDSLKPQPFTQRYPLDVLNYLATQGWRVVSVFYTEGSGNEIRHYLLAKKE